MTIKEALEVSRKQYNCWTNVSIECPIQCEKCENNVNLADFLEALKTVLDAFGNGSEIPNSSDLVSRSYLLAEYDRQHQGPPGGARKIIEEAPPVQAERKKGKWIKKAGSDLWYCSECDLPSMHNWPYCERCGTDMRKDNE